MRDPNVINILIVVDYHTEIGLVRKVIHKFGSSFLEIRFFADSNRMGNGRGAEKLSVTGSPINIASTSLLQFAYSESYLDDCAILLSSFNAWLLSKIKKVNFLSTHGSHMK